MNTQYTVKLTLQLMKASDPNLELYKVALVCFISKVGVGPFGLYHVVPNLGSWKKSAKPELLYCAVFLFLDTGIDTGPLALATS